MNVCGDCGFEARSVRGLGQHRQSSHRSDGSGANAAAVVVMLSELERMGRLKDVDAARVQMLRSMAAALDDNPFNSQMWKVYGDALEGLRVDDGDNGALEILLTELSS